MEGVSLTVPEFSTALTPKLERKRQEQRVIYRCKQRGVLELDMLMGTWVEQNIAGLSQAELDSLEELSLQESPFLLKWVLKQASVPPQLDTPLLRKLQHYAINERKSWQP